MTLHRRKASRDKNYPCRGQTTRSSLFRTNVRSGNPDLMGDIRRVKRKTPGEESPLKNQRENSTQTQQYPPPCNSVPALSCAQVISRKRTAVGSVLSAPLLFQIRGTQVPLKSSCPCCALKSLQGAVFCGERNKTALPCSSTLNDISHYKPRSYNLP